MPLKNNQNSPEFRQDIISGEWVLIAPQRNKRLKKIKKKVGLDTSVKTCPFENISKTHPIIFEIKEKNWFVVVVPNKYPAVIDDFNCPLVISKNFYNQITGIGVHDLIITSNHNKNFAQQTLQHSFLVLLAFRERYKQVMNNSCISYISIFHNWGREAGATIYHPHYQLIAIPVIPPNILHYLNGSKRYFVKNKRCVHCDIIANEKKHKIRILYENKSAIVIAPYVSKEPFELRIYPKKHNSFFEETPDNILYDIADALYYALNKIEKKLKKPDYNFFINTAPVKYKSKFSFYHWFIEIIPKLNIDAGFELNTGIEINTISPEMVIKILK
ncbi:MAG: galactose-1-phosphate uridylyltransferase [Minisyncoccia bacterium]